MKLRIITSVALAAGLAMSLSACAKKEETVVTPPAEAAAPAPEAAPAAPAADAAAAPAADAAAPAAPAMAAAPEKK